MAQKDGLGYWQNNQELLFYQQQEEVCVVPPNVSHSTDSEGDTASGQNVAESGLQESIWDNSARTILESSAEGRQILDIGMKSPTLSSSVRGRLCKLLLEKLIPADKPILPTDAQLLSLSKDIGRLFKKESPSLYYAPYRPADAYQAKKNTSGWLVSARRARRAHLMSLGLLAMSKSRTRSDHSVKTNVTSSLGIDLEHLKEGDADQVASSLEQLSKPAAGLWQKVRGLWRDTVRARLQCLYFEKGTLQEYFEKYPILQSPNGWRLLTSDYDALFPDKTGGLASLAVSTGDILEAARKKFNTTKDKYLRQRIEDTLAICDAANPETNLIAAILLVGCLFNIPPARRYKKDWQASRAEVLDGFVTIIDTEANVQATIEERRQKLQSLEIDIQPFIIWCRDSGAAFAVCDTVLYKFTSLPEAMDTTFKIFHATGAKYPVESYDIWIIIQIAFYKVQTGYDRLSQSVKETLVTLGCNNLS